MKLSDILSITSLPGLYKFVAQGRKGAIVEPIEGGKRTMINNVNRLSSLGDIAIYTTSDEVPLGDVLEAINEKYSNKELPLNKKSSIEELVAFMEEILPEYDRDMVHISDIQRLVSWYNALVKVGMTTFVETDEEEIEEADSAEE